MHNITKRVEHLEQDKITQALEITKLKQRVKKLEMSKKLKVFKLRRLKKVGTAQRIEISDALLWIMGGKQSQAQIYQIDLEHADKLMTEVVTAAATMTAVATAAAPTLTTAPSTAGRRRASPKKRERRQCLRYQALKRKPQTEAQARKNMMIYLRNMVGFKMDYFKGMSYDAIRPICEKKFNSNVVFLEKTKERIKEEDSKALKRKVESSEDKAAKKHKLDEEERFASTKPKNFSDDFLLTTLGAMSENPDVQAQIWRNQRSVHGLAKVKSWKLLDSCGVQIITFTTTQLILLVERKYPLTRFTLDQMLNNVRLEVQEESEVSLELLSFGVDAAKDFKDIL
nr:hypothetical protein [Tanacetum cinerariifolium]